MQLASIQREELAITIRVEGAQLVCRIEGSADAAVLDALEEMCRLLHAEARRIAAPEVIVDVTALEYVSSPCFKTLVMWLTELCELPDRQQYRVTFLSSPTRAWQRRSLASLCSLAEELVTVEAS